MTVLLAIFVFVASPKLLCHHQTNYILRNNNCPVTTGSTVLSQDSVADSSCQRQGQLSCHKTVSLTGPVTTGSTVLSQDSVADSSCQRQVQLSLQVRGKLCSFHNSVRISYRLYFSDSFKNLQDMILIISCHLFENTEI